MVCNIPKLGTKLKYKGTHHFWISEILQNALSLKLNNVYTLDYVNPHSTWIQVKLKEIPDKIFALSFFEEIR